MTGVKWGNITGGGKTTMVPNDGRQIVRPLPYHRHWHVHLLTILQANIARVQSIEDQQYVEHSF